MGYLLIPRKKRYNGSTLLFYPAVSIIRLYSSEILALACYITCTAAFVAAETSCNAHQEGTGLNYSTFLLRNTMHLIKRGILESPFKAAVHTYCCGKNKAQTSYV